LCSPFAVVVILSFDVLVVLVSFVAFVVLVAPFVFAALVVCTAGAVLHVVVAEVVVKQNKEASTKAEQIQSIKQKTEKQKT
jgi:arginine exporter protein ArgO